MTELRLYAVGIDEVRDIFGADAALADRLMAAAKVRWFDNIPEPRRGILDKIGPLTKKALLPATPDMPTRADAEALLAGRYVAPERTLPAWRLLEGWVSVLAHDTLRLPMSAPDLDQLDFDLVAAGMPAELAIERAFRHETRVPLRPLPGMRIGYAKHAQALATADALRRVGDDVDPRSRGAADALRDWFAHYPCAWQDRATRDGRPAPDLVALWLA